MGLRVKGLAVIQRKTGLKVRYLIKLDNPLKGDNGFEYGRKGES